MYKGVDTLVTAWPIVAQSVPDACLLLVGEGNDRARIERIAQEAAVLDSVRFLGRVSDERLRTLYAEVCLFALPGRASMGEAPEGEGFGLVFIEAQAAGLPVVAGRAAGAREAVLDGETGLLVDPEDPSDVARAIIALLEDGRRRDDMARAGVEFVATQFSYDRFTRQIADVLQRITET
jgi:phosphatidylinositol alpha-1,6-mannosyltransferase